MRFCKIVGTIGPASSDPRVLEQLIEAGLNVARINCSHGALDVHRTNIENIRKIAKSQGKTVSILLDLQGPKIRCGQLKDGILNIEAGERYALRYGEKQTEDGTIPIDYRGLVGDVSVGHRVLMDDGLIHFVIESINSDSVTVLATTSGQLKSRKGVNFPESVLSLPALTEKDSRDLLFGISVRVDYIALSFVQRRQDIENVKSMIAALGSDIPIIAKIEKLSALDEIDDIAQAADGLMVARGDLGVEANFEKVPRFQKQIIAAARSWAKPVIIATQMLESMVKNPRPSLAEIADVANGVLDQADCVMLSAEVAAGKYPVECVKKMVEIIRGVESWEGDHHQNAPVTQHLNKLHMTELPTNEAVAVAACEAAEAVGAKAIVCLSLTGSIARIISRWRPRVPIYALSPRDDVIQRIMLVWGVTGVSNPIFYQTDRLLQDLPSVLRELNLVESGETVVITAGIPINRMTATNMVKIHKIP